ncbi:hypothetical protein [Alicyclobacillus dauci]|uniref:DUF5667 domain-containing protein n=1 Tax=Alicyclobacillus dauci TaxID=1475485 RepID=A0ABY6Z6Y3_9BACL|nr:hypothetical protein [Alicyclobacillus dauci]WAH37931.1 hypothetical protein NZD86_05415 [Alicyclobacillus dauci]
MRKTILLSAVSLCALLGMLCSQSPVYADDNSRDSHSRHAENTSKSGHSTLFNQGQLNETSNASTHSNNDDHTNSDVQVSINLSQIVTQFQQAISHDGINSTLGSHPARSHTSETKDNHTPATKPNAPTNQTNSTVIPGGLNESNSSLSITSHLSSGSTNSSDNHTSQSRGHQSGKGHTKSNEVPGGSSLSKVTVGPSTRASVNVGLTAALAAYHTATAEDTQAQTQLSNAMNLYLQLVRQAIQTGQQNVLTAHNGNIQAVLDNLQRALQEQNQNNQLLNALRNEANGNPTSLVGTLQNMTSVEDKKAMNLTTATKMLQGTSMDIRSAMKSS